MVVLIISIWAPPDAGVCGYPPPYDANCPSCTSSAQCVTQYCDAYNECIPNPYGAGYRCAVNDDCAGFLAEGPDVEQCFDAGPVQIGRAHV